MLLAAALFILASPFLTGGAVFGGGVLSAQLNSVSSLALLAADGSPDYRINGDVETPIAKGDKNGLKVTLDKPVSRTGRWLYECTGLAYWDDTAMTLRAWRLPDQFDDDDYYNMRFSVATVPEEATCTLKTGSVIIFGPLTQGTPTLRILFWDDDGFGFPNNKLDSVDVPYEDLPTDLDWVDADISAGNWVFSDGDEYHVGWTTIGGPGDVLYSLSDEATGPHSGEYRASEFFHGEWQTVADVWGLGDVCFLIKATHCCTPEQQIIDESMCIQPLGRLLPGGPGYTFGETGTQAIDPIRVEVRDAADSLITDSTGQVIPTPVTFEITSTPPGATGHVLLPCGTPTCMTMTDATGIAAVDLMMGSAIGTYSVIGYAPDSSFTGDTVSFLAYSEGYPHTIIVTASSPHTANGVDASAVSITVTDVAGDPVSGAEIECYLINNFDGVDTLTVTDDGGGQYSASAATTLAGPAAIKAYATSTGASGMAYVEFVPGPVDTLDMQAAGFRDEAPKESATITLKAKDMYGNVLSNALTDLTIETDTGTVAIDSCDETHCWATLTLEEWGTATVVAIDNTSLLADTVTVVSDPITMLAPEGALIDSILDVPLNLYLPADSGNLDSFVTIIEFDNTLLQLEDIVDGDLTDNIPTPDWEMIDPGRIRVYQMNEGATSTPSMDVAIMQFSILSEGIATLQSDLVGFYTDHGVYLSFEDVEVVAVTLKPLKTVDLTIWLVEDANGDPYVPQSQATAEILRARSIFFENAEACRCPCYIDFNYEFKRITNADWKNQAGADETLQDGELGNLPTSAGSHDVYYVPGTDFATQGDRSQAGDPHRTSSPTEWARTHPAQDGITMTGGANGIGDSAGGKVLAHELGHLLSNPNIGHEADGGRFLMGYCAGTEISPADCQNICNNIK